MQRKRIICALIAVVMLFGMLPKSLAFDSDFDIDDYDKRGLCGETLFYHIKGNTLTIGGYGYMYDYNYYSIA